ncbi:MAG: bifunctional phosphoglucose/phosphomannose isomerase [Candidatus Marinimicrobia bacterium]|nr:bifunctional phosphoglucose/phosphomannose isomerase [Candidatus Neomarinimicrobiota bacterium]MCF7830096.1 bifunctional phosphoglucose/phosphomannose isomerase [Candidatus Neomarinimicrobiota bacterium]MCF7882143.1 bifunctional phosphoglucose/phosphomannose isomerase [Candidatus Neomarinimicrobiota bacterium]
MDFAEIENNREQLDPQNMWEAVAGFGDQIQDAAEISLPDTSSIDSERIQNIVFCGMGGSAIGGDLIATYAAGELSVPMIVNRNYTLPGFVGEHSLVVISSYSGNTEETLSSLHMAEEAGAQIVGISSNGEVEQRFNSQGYPLISIPGGMQPRAALGFSFIPMVRLFNQIGLLPGNIETDIAETIATVKPLSNKYQSAGEENTAFATAAKLINTVPIIYTTPELEVVGVRWKGQLAENAQMLAFQNRLPEMNHNEIMGWDQQPEFMKTVSLIWLYDEEAHPKVNRRREVTSELLRDYPQSEHTFSTEGTNRMSRLISLIHLGDWISLYAALLQEVDPTPVERISLLKSRLAESN